MDLEKRARRQSLRIIISEILMVVAVIATVSILAFVVSGYWVGSDFQIERQGLLQVYSSPTGADVSIDGNPSSWLQRTNTSKTLAAGEHTVVLTKEGYDSWSRTVDITEGLLYRLHYPRLFLKERTKESALDFSATPVEFATISPDRNTMVLKSASSWQLFNLDSDSSKLTTIKLDDALSATLSGTVKSARWASDNEHLLLNLASEDSKNWVIFNIKNPSASVNLTKEFNADFSAVEILDSSASNVLVVLDHNLHRIDVAARQISAVLIPDVISFDYFNQEIIFSAASGDPANYYLGALRLGGGEITKLCDLASPASVVVTKFYDDEYIGVMEGPAVAVYQKHNFEKTADFTLNFTPEQLRVTNAGDAIIMNAGAKIASLDMEVMQITEWSPETTDYGWLDGSMIYAVKDGSLTVYDFNSLNPRSLATGVSSSLPVTITSDKYLYYFKNGTLIREYL